MIFERLRGKKGLFHGLPLFIQILLTNGIVMFSWVIFRSPTLEQGWNYWKSMVGAVVASPTTPLLHATLFTPKNIVAMIICCIVVWQTTQAHDWVKKLTATKAALCMIVFVYAVFVMFTQTYNPFLYFQF